MSLSDSVKEKARQLGFELVGITTPDPPLNFPIYQHWLEAGRHGSMEYLAAERSRERRADPRQILPECLSIIVLGIRYWDPRAENPDPAEGLPHGRVASYAWAADYHEVLPPRLQALVAFIEEQIGEPVPNRWYTDTGPILERDMAQRAGLGWIGKNTCLIHPRAGSYFLLAEILLGVELEPDLPFVTDHCGSCTRCLDACPTQCILPDRTLDAARCISYLTIELKTAIPGELRPQMENWVFGCDVCQEVCPWNVKFSKPEGDPQFAPQAGVAYPDLMAEIALSPEQFNSKFKGSPVKRTKRRGYLRNVAIALGNAGDDSAVPVLRKALFHDPEPLVRAHAAWALGQIGGERAKAALAEAEKSEADPEVLAEIRVALAQDLR
jgi:epoxyqueuosine reductase